MADEPKIEIDQLEEQTSFLDNDNFIVRESGVTGVRREKRFTWATLKAKFLKTADFPSDSAETVVTSLDNGWTGTIKYIKRAGTVFITFFELNGSAQTSTHFFQMPAGYRPASTSWDTLTDVSSTPNKSVSVFVQSPGPMKVSADTDASGTRINGSISYPVL